MVDSEAHTSLSRLLIVGLGSIGTRHARIARQLLPNAQITVLRHRGCRGVNTPGVDYCVTSMEEALALRPQAAIIANPASHHVAAALELARAGVDLLVEKPISDTTAGVYELIETCCQHSVVLTVGYDLRFSPALKALRNSVHAGRVGRVLSVRAEVGQFLPSWRPGADYRQTVSAKAELGGGVLLELSHELDYLRWIFGEVQWVSAVHARQSALEIDVEDTAHLVLAFSSQADVAPVIAQVTLDCIRHDTTRGCTVVGETGTLRWNALTGVVDVFDQGAAGWNTLFSHREARDEAYLAEWDAFLRCIDDRSAPSISGNDALEVLRVVAAARQSSELGEVVHLASV